MLALLGLIVAGCGDGTAQPDAGGDAAVSDGGALDAAADAGTCGVRVTATIGAEGGTLAHCDGARLEIPAGALEADTELWVERLDGAAVPMIGSPYVLAGPVFRFGPAGTSFGADARYLLPHGGGGRMEMAALIEGEWAVLEVCGSDETHVWQSFRSVGTFAAAHDPTDYPEGPTGLGSGSVDFTFDGMSTTIAIEARNGHAIDEQIGQGRSLTLLYRRSDDMGLEQLDVRLVIDAAGAVTPIQVAYANTAVGEIWDVAEFAYPDDLTITITSDDGTAIRGTIAATLHRGEETRALSATFEASSVEWRYPPERACGMIEG